MVELTLRDYEWVPRRIWRLTWLPVVSFDLPSSFSMWLSGVYLLTVFDLIGYWDGVTNMQHSSYRATQIMFTAVVCACAIILGNVAVAVAILISALSLLCDGLYYLALWYPLEPMTWNRYSPAGILYRYILREQAITVAGWWWSMVLGIGAAVAVLLLWAPR